MSESRPYRVNGNYWENMSADFIRLVRRLPWPVPMHMVGKPFCRGVSTDGDAVYRIAASHWLDGAEGALVKGVADSLLYEEGLLSFRAIEEKYGVNIWLVVNSRDPVNMSDNLSVWQLFAYAKLRDCGE